MDLGVLPISGAASLQSIKRRASCLRITADKALYSRVVASMRPETASYRHKARTKGTGNRSGRDAPAEFIPDINDGGRKWQTGVDKERYRLSHSETGKKCVQFGACPT